MTLPVLDKRYIVVSSAFVIQGVMIGILFAYGVLFTALESELGWSRTLLSASFSVSFLVMGIGGILVGRLNDRLGPRLLMTLSGICFGVGYAAMYFMSAPWHLFILYGLLVGAGTGAHDVITLSTVARWFDRRRGLMTGVVKVGTACGQMTIPVLVSTLLLTVGWREACLVIGLGATLLLLLAAQGLQRNPIEDGGARTGPSPEPEPGLRFADAARSRPFWTLCAVQFCFLPTLVTVPVHIVPHAIDLGMGQAQAALVLSVMGACSVAGRLAIGAGADRLGSRKALMACLAVLIASLGILQLIQATWPLYLFAAIYGIAHGGLFTVVSLVVAEYFGTAAHGAIFGAVLFFGTLGGAVGPLLAGQAFDVLGSYSVAFTTLTAMAGLALVFVSTLRHQSAAAP